MESLNQKIIFSIKECQEQLEINSDKICLLTNIEKNQNEDIIKEREDIINIMQRELCEKDVQIEDLHIQI